MSPPKITFGRFLRDQRIAGEVTLRKACRHTNWDPSNWSKVERGLLAPPKDNQLLESWAIAIKIKRNSKEWNKFFELAELAHGEIPSDVFEHEEIAELLPAFFRTARGKKPTKEEVAKIIHLIKNA